jgi:hypothetical protein
MTLLPKAVAALTAAVLVAASPVLSDAAGAHPSGHHKGAHQHSKPADHFAGLRRGAAHAIKAQLKAVQRVVDRAAALTIADAVDLQSALGADLAAVQADLDGVSTAADRGELHKLMTAANVARQVARLQSQVVVAADAAAAEAAGFSATVTSLQGALTTLAAGGTDTSAGDATLVDASTMLATAAAQAPGVVAYVLLLGPTASRADVNAASDAVHTALESIADVLAQVAADIESVQTQFGV